MRALSRWRFWQVALLGVSWLLLAPLLAGGGFVLAGTVLDLLSGRREVALRVSLTDWSVIVGLCLPPVILVGCWFRARSLYADPARTGPTPASPARR